MKVSAILLLFILSTFSLAIADDRNQKEPNHQTIENRYDDLKEQMYEIKYDLRAQIKNQSKTIKEQEEKIIDLQLIIKNLDSALFQTTQSLRNLELEVWDMKKASNN